MLEMKSHSVTGGPHPSIETSSKTVTDHHTLHLNSITLPKGHFCSLYKLTTGDRACHVPDFLWQGLGWGWGRAVDSTETGRLRELSLP